MSGPLRQVFAVINRAERTCGAVISPNGLPSTPSHGSGAPGVAGPARSPLRWHAGVLLAVWGLSVAAGIGILAGYASAPGPVAPESPSQWPSDSAVRPGGSRPTLIMLAHPHCPCTRASLAEFGEAVVRCRGAVEAVVLFVRPPGVEPGWERTASWDAAEAMAGVSIACDIDGTEAGRFGAATSGHVLLYGADGRLLFTGGVTPARGHGGENAGRKAIVELVGRGSATGTTRTPVYGCPLKARADECVGGTTPCPR